MPRHECVALDVRFRILGHETHEHAVEDPGAEDVAGAGTADKPRADAPCQVDPVAPALDPFPEFLPVLLATVRVHLLATALEKGGIALPQSLDLLPVIREDMFRLLRAGDHDLIESDRGGRLRELPPDRSSSARSASSWRSGNTRVRNTFS